MYKDVIIYRETFLFLILQYIYMFINMLLLTFLN